MWGEAGGSLGRHSASDISGQGVSEVGRYGGGDVGDNQPGRDGVSPSESPASPGDPLTHGLSALAIPWDLQAALQRTCPGVEEPMPPAASKQRGSCHTSPQSPYGPTCQTQVLQDPARAWYLGTSWPQPPPQPWPLPATSAAFTAAPPTRHPTLSTHPRDLPPASVEAHAGSGPPGTSWAMLAIHPALVSHGSLCSHPVGLAHHSSQPVSQH